VRVSAGAPLPIAIPPQRRRVLVAVVASIAGIALGALLLRAAGLRRLDEPFDLERDLARALGLLLVIACALGVRFGVPMLRGPSLELREAGIMSRTSSLGRTLIAWHDVRGVRVAGGPGGGHRQVFIQLADVESVLARLSLPSRTLVRLQREDDDDHEVHLVGEGAIDGELEDVAARIAEELARRRGAVA
jgi:hypothetical protein